MSRDLSRAHPFVADAVRRLIAECNEAWGERQVLIVTRVDATAEEQHSLWEQGRTKPGAVVTQCDGYEKVSRHQAIDPMTGLPASDAVDLCVMVDPDGPGPIKAVCDWSNKRLFREMGVRAEKLGLKWGGRWRKADGPHVERSQG